MDKGTEAHPTLTNGVSQTRLRWQGPVIENNDPGHTAGRGEKATDPLLCQGGDVRTTALAYLSLWLNQIKGWPLSRGCGTSILYGIPAKWRRGLFFNPTCDRHPIDLVRVSHLLPQNFYPVIFQVCFWSHLHLFPGTLR